MKPVAILGAGITGLTTAFYLKRAGIPITLYEVGNRVGGAIQSIRKDGYLAECGPNTILETSHRIARLIRDAGLQSRRIESDPSAGARYLVRYGRPMEVPETPLGFLGTQLFSWKAKFAFMREPFVPARRNKIEESVADFVVRRLGREFLDHAIDAMVGGVYAGDPARLSVSQAFPKLADLEDHYGSLIKGSILGLRERRKRGDIAKDRAPKFSFDEGLQVLPDALAQYLEEDLCLESAVTAIHKEVDLWKLSVRVNGKEFFSDHCAVIYAGTAHKLADLKVDFESKTIDFSPFSEIRYPPVASVVMGFRREDVDHPCQGFGALIPKVEGFKILGTIFSSSLFARRAPERHLTLTTYIGGERYPELALLPPKEIYELVEHDLQRLLGVRGNPTFRHCALYPKAIPQYNLGYGRFHKLMDEIEATVPQFYFAGNYRDGISLSDSIISGCKMAERVEKSLRSSHPSFS